MNEKYKSFDKRVYMNEEDQQNAQALGEALHRNGVPGILKANGKVELSALVRHLIREELVKVQESA
jgi:hypothetical protein